MGVFVEAIASDPRVRRLYFDVSGVAGSATGGRVRPRSPRDWGGIERAGTDGAGGPNPTPEQGGQHCSELPLTEEEFRTIAENVRAT